jgi:branched-chain amino acid transport system substrate-binding protein
MLGVLLFPSRASSQGTTGGQGDTIRIGVINSLTGLFADQGRLVQNGILLAVDEINAKGGVNGRKIVLSVEDDGSNTQRAVRAFRKLAESKVQAIIGPLSSGGTMATAKLADQFGIPQVVPTAHSAKLRGISRNVFLIYPNTDDEARFIAEVATKRLNKKRVAILMPDNQFSNEFTAALSNYVREGGGTIVANQRFKESATNFRADITRLRRLKPDVLVIPSFLPVAPVALAREIASQGFIVSVISKGAACLTALLALDDLVLPASVRDNMFFVNETFGKDHRGIAPMQEFITSYQRRFRSAPSPYSAMGSASVDVVRNAIERGGSESASIQQALGRTEVETAFGTVRFNENQVNTGIGFSLYRLNTERSKARRGELVLVQ